MPRFCTRVLCLGLLFSAPAGAGSLDIYSPGLLGWELQSAGSPAVVTWFSSAQVDTTAGELVIAGADLNFQASGSGGASVPEPAGLALAGFGLAAVALLLRRRS